MTAKHHLDLTAFGQTKKFSSSMTHKHHIASVMINAWNCTYYIKPYQKIPLTAFSTMGYALAFTASQSQWCSDPHCLDNSRQSNLLYLQAGLLGNTVRGKAASWQLKAILPYNEMSELRAKEETAGEERRGDSQRGEESRECVLKIEIME